MGALDYIVRSGRALYVGISSYNSQRTREAVAILNDLGTPCLIHQPSYNMLNRWVETDGLKDTLQELGVGSIAFTPLAQGMLTNKYFGGVPRVILYDNLKSAVIRRRGQTIDLNKTLCDFSIHHNNLSTPLIVNVRAFPAQVSIHNPHLVQSESAKWTS